MKPSTGLIKALNICSNYQVKTIKVAFILDTAPVYFSIVYNYIKI